MTERFTAPQTLTTLANALCEQLRLRGLRVSTAESCTGGLIAAALTDIPGSSDVFWGGWVTYSNAAKSALLGVPERMIAQHGAVSAEVAAAMARGALAKSDVDYAVAVTGVAGPGGGTATKPVGLVWFGFAGPAGAIRIESMLFRGDRCAVRTATVCHALARLVNWVSEAD